MSKKTYADDCIDRAEHLDFFSRGHCVELARRLKRATAKLRQFCESKEDSLTQFVDELEAMPGEKEGEK